MQSGAVDDHVGLVENGQAMTASFIYDTSAIARTVNFDIGRVFHYTDSLGRRWDRYVVQRGGVGTMFARVSELRVSTVPEPGTLALLGTAPRSAMASPSNLRSGNR